jgi:hypothetical protein
VTVSVCFIMDFPGATLDQYDRVIEAMDLGGENAPGGIAHAAGLHEGSLRVIDVWESDEAFQAFAEAKIGPLTAAEGIPEPEITRVPVHRTRDERHKGEKTTFVQVVRLPGLSTEAFDAADARIVPGDVSPDGLTFHVSGPDGDGFLVADGWTSKGARDAFMDANIRPVMENTEMAGPPSFEELDVHNTLRPRAAATA